MGPAIRGEKGGTEDDEAPLLPIVLVLFGFAFLFWAFWFG